MSTPLYETILCPVDLRRDSGVVLRRAAALASQQAAQLVVLHVVEYVPLDPVGDTLPVNPVQLTQELVDNARQRLDELCDECGLSDDAAQRVVQEGRSEATILAQAKQSSADLIVIGNHERHGLAILLSRTEDGVLHHAPCDVLAVHLDD